MYLAEAGSAIQLFHPLLISAVTLVFIGVAEEYLCQSISTDTIQQRWPILRSFFK
jgi:hypothetical protein